MDTKVILQPAFLIHQRKYRETSSLLDVLTKDFGLVRLIARGHKRRTRGGNILQPYRPLLISWFGKSTLKTLMAIDRLAVVDRCSITDMSSKQLFIGMYINELIIKLLTAGVAYPYIYHIYHKLLSVLSDSDFDNQWFIVCFEYQLLYHLGYGINLEQDSKQNPINSDIYYTFVPEQGFIEQYAASSLKHDVYLGRELIELANLLCLSSEFVVDDKVTIRVVKLAQAICDLSLKGLLNNNKLHSKDILQSLYFDNLREVAS